MLEEIGLGEERDKELVEGYAVKYHKIQLIVIHFLIFGSLINFSHSL